MLNLYGMKFLHMLPIILSASQLPLSSIAPIFVQSNRVLIHSNLFYPNCLRTVWSCCHSPESRAGWRSSKTYRCSSRMMTTLLFGHVTCWSHIISVYSLRWHFVLRQTKIHYAIAPLAHLRFTSVTVLQYCAIHLIIRMTCASWGCCTSAKYKSVSSMPPFFVFL